MNSRTTPRSRFATGHFGGALRALAGLALGALALASTGCFARARAGGMVSYSAPTVEVAAAPVEVEYEYYPSYYYGGSYVYLVDGRWYHRPHGTWVVMRSEPQVLASVRVHYEAKYGKHYRPKKVGRPEVASPRPKVRRHRDKD